jgi:hypothetical protein
MTGDELVCRVAITVLAPALSQHEFVLPGQHREPADFFKIMSKAGVSRKDRPSGSKDHARGTN